MKKKLKITTEELKGRKALENPKSRDCTLGISLGKTYFSKENVEAYMRFGIEHFNKMLIWIADYPERWNHTALKGINYEDATRKALHQGKQEISKFSKIVRKLEQEGIDRGRINITDFLSLFQNPNYKNVLERIYQEYTDNPLFKKDMIKWLQRNIGGKFKDRNLKGSALEQAVETSVNYLLEETAMMIYLADIHKNRYIDIYPAPYSDIICMKALNEGKYPELRDDLGLQEGYGYIDVRIKRPFSEIIGERVGNKIGKNPKQRRKMREIISSSFENISVLSKLGLAATIMIAPYIALDLVTAKSKDTVVVNREKYRIIERINGTTEVYPGSLFGVTWYDYNSDGKIDCSQISFPRFPSIREESQAFLERANNIYEIIKTEMENAQG